MGRPVEVPSYRSGPYQVQLRPRDVSAPGYRTGPYLVHIRLSPETPAKRQTSESKATFQAPADNRGVPAAPAPRSVADQLAAVARAVDALILDEDPLIQINPGPVVPGAAAPTPAVGMRTPAAEPTAEAVPKTRVPATAEAAINNAVSTLTTDRAEESAGLGATKLRRSRASLLSAVLIAGILIVWTGP